MTDDEKTTEKQLVLPFAISSNLSSLHGQQMSENDPNCHQLGEEWVKNGGSLSAELIRIVETWPALQDATRQAIIAIIDAAQARKKAG